MAAFCRCPRLLERRRAGSQRAGPSFSDELVSRSPVTVSPSRFAQTFVCVVLSLRASAPPPCPAPAPGSRAPTQPRAVLRALLGARHRDPEWAPGLAAAAASPGSWSGSAPGPGDPASHSPRTVPRGVSAHRRPPCGSLKAAALPRAPRFGRPHTCSSARFWWPFCRVARHASCG